MFKFFFHHINLFTLILWYFEILVVNFPGTPNGTVIVEDVELIDEFGMIIEQSIDPQYKRIINSRGGDR